MFRILNAIAANLSTGWGDIVFAETDDGIVAARPSMHPGESVTYSILRRLPTEYRTRSDVNATRNALYAGGHRQRSAVDGQYSVAWKAERGVLSLGEMVGYAGKRGNAHPTLTITPETYAGLIAYYGEQIS